MTRQGLLKLGSADYDLVILENVGNLVCPAEFDTGAAANITILSVPEGDDKPLKYPLMYETCQLLIVNKTDVLPWFDFDCEKLKEYAKKETRRSKYCLFPQKPAKGSVKLPDGSGKNSFKDSGIKHLSVILCGETCIPDQAGQLSAFRS